MNTDGAEAAGRVSAGTAYLRSGGIEPVRRNYQPVDLFLFSAATWNPHRIHYDQAYATSTEGYRDLVVQGPLQAAEMFQALRSRLADGIAITAVQYRHHSLLHVGEPVLIAGELVAADDDRAVVEMWVSKENTDERTTTGRASLRRAGWKTGGSWL